MLVCFKASLSLTYAKINYLPVSLSRIFTYLKLGFIARAILLGSVQGVVDQAMMLV